MKTWPLPAKIGDPFFDIRGREWQFYAEMRKNAPIEELKKEFQLELHWKRADGFLLHCLGKFRFRAIYLNANGCLYARGQHDHANEGRIEGEQAKATVGKIFGELAKIGKKWEFWVIFIKKNRFEFGLENIINNY